MELYWSWVRIVLSELKILQSCILTTFGKRKTKPKRMTAYKPTHSNLHSAFSPTPLEEEFYKTKPTDKKKSLSYIPCLKEAWNWEENYDPQITPCSISKRIAYAGSWKMPSDPVSKLRQQFFEANSVSL